MNKSFGMALRQTQEAIVNAINSSGLPLDAINLMLGEIRSAVSQQAQIEYQKELKQLTEQNREVKDGAIES